MRLYQLPESSRMIASIPYGRLGGRLDLSPVHYMSASAGRWAVLIYPARARAPAACRR